MRVAIVEQRQSLSDPRLPCASKPAGLSGRQFTLVPPQSLREEHLGQLGEHRTCSGVSSRSLRDRESQRVFEPLTRRVLADVQANIRRQTAEKGLAQMRVAGEIAADEPAR